MKSWRLENAAEIAAESKYTFYRPSDDVIGKVAVGEVVKLIFEFDSGDQDAPAAERMWVLVDSIDGKGGFTGRLNNQPYHIKDLKLNDPVSFRDIHIINTEHDDDNNLVNKYLPRCYVTNKVLYGGEKVGYLYRESPDHDNDSGWRIMVGDETEEYMDDPNNSSYVSLGAVLSKDDSIVDLLDSPVGATYERASDDGGFIEVQDES